LLQETLVILKPDALERKLSGEIISRFEKECLKILDLKYIKKASNEILIQHYPDSMALSIGKKAQKATPSIKDRKLMEIRYWENYENTSQEVQS